MTTPPDHIKIYHISHVDNLSFIIAAGGLWSDRIMSDLPAGVTRIGITEIKSRRLKLPVSCFPDVFVGDCVPFYFCPRSVMLYVLHKGNLPGVDYQAGQSPLVHLQADLHAVVTWAEAQERRWAFSASNAGARYTGFYSNWVDLDQIDWEAVGSLDFRVPLVKDAKQAEFLLQDFFPWELVEVIGVHSKAIQAKVETTLSQAAHRPPVVIQKGWYF